MDAARAGTFIPSQLGAVTSWLRLAASTPVSSEYETIVDVLNSNPATQTDADRKPAAGTSGNGLPTMVFDGSDVISCPLISNNNHTATLGYWCWFKPASVATVQHLFSVVAPNSSAQKIDVYTNNAQVFVECYISGVNGRFGRTGNVLTAGAWTNIYVQYDSSRGGDANLAIFIDKVSQSLTYGNLGAGGTLTTLPVVTGNYLFGGSTNSDTPTQPIANGGETGPNYYILGSNLTAGEQINLYDFERPTV
jgi:hypothetical protein